MGVMRWALYNRLKALYDNVSMTYGYITKNTRIKNNLPKDHYIDARCISGNPLAKPLGYIYEYKKLRRHNRKIYKFKTLKGGFRKKNQCTFKVFGFELYDKVKIDNKKIAFIYGRRARGVFDVRTFNGERLYSGITYKRLFLVQHRGAFLINRRNA